MADRETVITHLMIVHTWAEFARERDLNFFTKKHLEDIAKWSDDALELLKKQEPMKPRSVSRHGAYPQIQHYCGACNAFLPRHKQEFCSVCGQAVKWGE